MRRRSSSISSAILRGIAPVTLGVIAAIAGGCASGLAQGDPCETDADCQSPNICIEGRCRLPPSADAIGGDDLSTPTDVPPAEDVGSPPSRDGVVSETTPSGEDGADSTAPPLDTVDTRRRDVGCPGGCGIGETCRGGSCVSKCNPRCNSNEQCLELEAGNPTCYAATCNEVLSGEGCARGTICQDVSRSQQRETLVCLPSQCQRNSDCSGSGTCLSFVNDVGICVDESGPRQPGQSCNLEASNQRCQPGSYCVALGANSTQGTCKKLCNPWASNPNCGRSQTCSPTVYDPNEGSTVLFNLRQGFCTDRVDSRAQAVFDPCSSERNVCTNATQCSGGGANSSPRCLKFCRLGKGDCSGVTSPSGRDVLCDQYAVPGDLGLCFPRCTPGDCPSGQTCRNGLCRVQCSTASDCCNSGASSCPFTCNNNGLCA